MSQNPSAYFLSKSLATPYRDDHGEFYTDMLRRSVLETEFHDDPEDVDVGEQLYDLYFRGEIYDAAARIAGALYGVSADNGWLVKQLRCRLFMRDYAGAAALHDAAQAQSTKPIISGWDAIQFMRDTIFRDEFLTMEETDYEKLFFLTPLMQRLGPHLRFLTYALMDRFFADLLVFAKEHVEWCGASFHYMSSSSLFGVENKSDCEIALAEGVTLAMQERRKLKWLQSNPPHMAEIHEGLPQYSNDYIVQLNPGLKNMVQSGKLMICDWESEFFNIRDGQRVTTGQPDVHEQVVHCVGESETFGYGTEDAHTFCSFLQARLNAEERGSPWRVENYGFPGGALPFSINSLLQRNISAGDIVVFFGFPQLDEALANQLGIEASHVSFSRPHEHGEVFVDDNHFGWMGHKTVADALYGQLFAPGNESSPRAPDKIPDPNALEAARCCIQFVKYLLFRRTYLAVEKSEMQAYLDYLDEQCAETVGQIGSVAVSCDPMTNGHLHLLEHAAKSCDFLYVFVIQEDASQFRFGARLHIVETALAHLDNVKVLKGGRYICTDVTVPEYSTKDEKNDAIADMSMEAWSFGEFIAKRLNITRIFLGREPICPITQQYNDQMEMILPKFGIAVEIIDRITHAGEAISASQVRAYLKEKRFDLIREIVPPATYAHLLRYYADPTNPNHRGVKG